MDGFYTGVLLLVALAASIVLLPLCWRGKGSAQDTLSNVQLVKGRLRELQQEHEQGLLSSTDKAQAEKELKLALVQEQSQNSSVAAKSYWLAGLVLLPLLGGVGYVAYLSSQQPKLQDQQRALGRLAELSERVVIKADPSIQPRDLQDFALAIREQVKQRPEDARGWLLLGRLHMALEQLEPALQAFEKGAALAPSNSGLLRSYAQALLLSADKANINRAKQLLVTLLGQKPGDVQVLGMLAVAVEQLGERAAALEYWRQVLSAMTPDDAGYPSVQAKVQELGGAVLPVLQIKVQLDPALQSALPEEGFVFVFAVAADGVNKMPAAVKKIPLSAFPMELILDENAAMLPGYSLQNLRDARIVARISQDENVAAQSGELQGEQVIQVVPAQQQLTLTINEEIQ